MIDFLAEIIVTLTSKAIGSNETRVFSLCKSLITSGKYFSVRKSKFKNYPQHFSHYEKQTQTSIEVRELFFRKKI